MTAKAGSPYTGGMKPIMKELRWMELPKGVRKTSASITFIAPPGTIKDNTVGRTLRMLAVSEENFTFTFSIPPIDLSQEIRFGPVIYQDPGDWFWASTVGAEEGMRQIRSSMAVRGCIDVVGFPASAPSDGTLSWRIRRKAERIAVSYALADTAAWQLVRDFELPSSGGAVSFGFLAGNSGTESIRLEVRSIRYQSDRAESSPIASSATTALV